MILDPNDTRRCVTATNQFPFRFICSLDLGGPSCSGTLIGPRTVLTAGHCLFDLETQPPSGMRAIPGRNGTSRLDEPFGYSLVAGFQLSPGYNSPTRGAGEGTINDYAVAILQDPVGNGPGWWTFQSFRYLGDPLGTRIAASDEDMPPSNASIGIDISGYPCDHPQEFHAGPARRRDLCFQPGNPQIDQGAIQYHDHNSLAGINGGILEYFNDTFHCMSGSPVWMERGGSRLMVAVHISGDDRGPNATPVLANRGVLIQGEVRDFVLAHSFSPPGTNPPPRPTVKLKSKGVTVRELQYRLNIWILTAPTSHERLKVDGDFGSKTLTATRAFQRAMGLTADGVVGPQTWRRLQLPF